MKVLNPQSKIGSLLQNLNVPVTRMTAVTAVTQRVMTGTCRRMPARRWLLAMPLRDGYLPVKPGVDPSVTGTVRSPSTTEGYTMVHNFTFI
jgi:hypothetical protein